jgi:integrase/recombinase XerD
VSDWDHYLQDFRSHLLLERSLSRHSIDAYEDDIRKLASFSESFIGSASPLSLTPAQLGKFNQWIATSGLSPSSQSRIISGVRGFYQFLLLERHLKQNPAELLESPRIPRKLPEILSVEEIDLMLSAIDRSTMEGERNAAILETLYSCGLRVSELIGLKISDLRLKKGFVRVTGKGNKERLVPIGASARKLISNYISSVRTQLTPKKTTWIPYFLTGGEIV